MFPSVFFVFVVKTRVKTIPISNEDKSLRITLPGPDEVLPGRPQAMQLERVHIVSGHSMMPPYPEGFERAMFGLGCFWGAERKFWLSKGVYITAVGYAAGLTPNPSYEEVCSGLTGHNEVVFMAFDPGQISYIQLLKVFWEGHDPTQGMRQGNDQGTQYRSGIYTYSSAQQTVAEASRQTYLVALEQAGYEPITTEIIEVPEFYFAEGYHQQYLAKNPNAYCGLGGTDVVCLI